VVISSLQIYLSSVELSLLSEKGLEIENKEGEGFVMADLASR